MKGDELSGEMQVQWNALDGWPGTLTPPEEQRDGAFFTTPENRSLLKLKDELRRIGSTSVVIATAHKSRDISVTTNSPRADREPAHSGVLVAADTKYGSLKWTCDQFTIWPKNLHAIALTLERLRLADLYGVTKGGKQYSGWKMLPGPITVAGSAPTMNMEDAARFVAGFTAGAYSDQEILKHKKSWQLAFREVAKVLHPDATGAQTGAWEKLQQAAQLLNSLHNRK